MSADIHPKHGELLRILLTTGSIMYVYKDTDQIAIATGSLALPRLGPYIATWRGGCTPLQCGFVGAPDSRFIET